MRLTDQGSAELERYLVTQTNTQFKTAPIPRPVPAAVHDLAMGYLVNTLSVRDAEAKLRAMPVREQLNFLGQRSIEKYGCYSCHNIKGYETLKPIGTELTTEGSKALHLFDFGFAKEYVAEDGEKEHIIDTVPSWV